MLITEVAPGITTSATGGDTVELYNSGPGAVDLTGYILSDLDPGAVETTITAEGTFAPGGLSLPPLGPGKFAVVEFTLGPAFYETTNYGLRIVANVASGYLDHDNDQLVLATPSGAALDSVAWHDDETSLSLSADVMEDLQGLTSPTAAYGLQLTSQSSWAGPDSINSAALYAANSVDFTQFAQSTSTYGRGVLQRRSTAGVWSEGAPDGTAEWTVSHRDHATFGNFSEPVPAPGGYLPILATDDVTTRVNRLESSSHPDRRIALDEDTNEFKIPAAEDVDAWREVVELALQGRWIEAHGLARPLGYEIVEMLDRQTSSTFYFLQESAVPGEPEYRGQGTYVFDLNTTSNPHLILEIPHPIHDSRTVDEAALALPQLRPRVTLFSGAHRNNATTDTTCDGTFENDEPYRVSDPAHFIGGFFQATHQIVEAITPNTITIQLHGMAGSDDGDVVISNGFNASSPVNAFVRPLKTRIDQQNYSPDDNGTPDLTTAALYPDDTSDFGGRNNVQGRFTNGVASELCCNTDATGASQRFVHIEQDLPVRRDPQHIITAIAEALEEAGLSSPLPVQMSMFKVD